MLQKLNRKLEKVMPLITPTSLVLGVLLSAYLKDFSPLIPWIFAFMTFSGSLSSNFRSLMEAFTHPLPMVIALMILHVFMPFWAWGVGHVIFSDDSFTITGLVLSMAIPTGISSFIWVSIYMGNIVFTLSIILLDTLLSPIIVPFTLSLLIGSKVELDVWGMMQGLFGMVVLPSILGMLLNQLTKGKVTVELGTRLAPFSKIGIGLVVMINGAVVAPYIRNVDLKLVTIAITVLCIAFTGYLFSFLFGRFILKDKENVIALTYTGGMRNISAGAVLAVSYFPAPVAIPVILGMLFQQVLASLFGLAVDRYYSKKKDYVLQQQTG